MRDDELNRKYNAPPSATSHNVTAFLFCLSLFLRKIIRPIEEQMVQLECFWKFSKFLSWIYRHNKQLLHEDLSLTLNELFWFPLFGQHINTGLSFIQHRDYAHHPYFGEVDSLEVKEECRKHQIPFESVRYFVPFVCVIWHNDKGRFSLAVQQENQVRLPRPQEWRTPPMDEQAMLDYIRHNGVVRGTNIFFRAQSGHSRISESQRLGVDYNFRHNILMHKTTAHNFDSIKHKSCRALKVWNRRDIHLVPVETLYSDPEMLRQYGERVILLNMNCPETREALRTAKETPNGYILVSEDIPMERFEAVYALEKGTWEFPFTPNTNPNLCASQGVDLAQDFCSYYSRCYVSRCPIRFEQLEEELRKRVAEAGQYYIQQLRHTGDDIQPWQITAETTAQQEKSERNTMSLIEEVVRDIGEAVKAESQQREKKKTEVKLMPTSAKKAPPDLPASVAKEEPPMKVKPPPACINDPDPKAKGKLPPKHLQTTSTDTTVKAEPKQPEGPPPPPPKRATDTRVKTEPKKAKTEETRVPTSTKNKISAGSGEPSSSSSTTARPIPTPPAPPTQTPQPPNHPPPDRSEKPSKPPRKPFDRGKFPHPTPPAPPTRASSDFWQNMRQSDTTDNRDPLPRQRKEPHDNADEERPPFDREYHGNSDLAAYVEVMESIAHTTPDSREAREQREVVWDRIATLVGRGVTTGSRMLDRMILQARNAVHIQQHVYHLPFVPTPAEHFMRQDPGEAGAIFRPSLMLKIEDEEFSYEVLDDLGTLGMNVLAGKAVLSSHPRHSSTEEHNVDTYYISLTILNLGRIDRPPYFAGKKRYGRDIREDHAAMKQKLVLPHIVLNNPGHIITLCESFDFTEFYDLCVEYGTIGIQCFSDKPDAAPPLAVFLKTPYGMLEVIHHWDTSKRTGSKSDGWQIHAAIVACTFGPRSHDINPGTRQRTVHRHTGDSIDVYAIAPDHRICTHGIRNVETREDELDEVESYQEIADSQYFPVRGYPTSYVQRMGLAEARVLCVHVNSYAFHNSLQRVREDLRAIFSKALMCMVDFICGDFNLFANRQFSRDTGGSIYGGIVLEVLEDAIRATNQQLRIENCVTFNISCSTAPQDVFDMVFESQDSGLDCMLCISLFYNKQDFDVPRPPILTDQFHLSHDYIHSVSERPRQLTVYDLCLGMNDCDWHLPLVCRINSHALKNKRTRGAEAQDARNQRYKSWASRYDKGKSKGKGKQHDREEHHWTDQQWRDDRGFQEGYWHPTRRHYGDRPNPYFSWGSSSSSSRTQYPGWYG